jgi:hypothetical protein
MRALPHPLSKNQITRVQEPLSNHQTTRHQSTRNRPTNELKNPLHEHSSKRFDALIDAESDDKNALSHEERGKREAQVLSNLLAVEREEAALVWAALEQALPCEHRADCNAQAILQCRMITLPPKPAGTGRAM